MRTLMIALMATVLTASANAQHDNHEAPAPAPKTPAAPAPSAADPHAGHTMPATETPPEENAATDEAVADPHAGHGMPAADTAPVAETAAHDMNAMDAAASRQPDASPPAAAFSGPVHAADTVFTAEAMARAREILHNEHGNLITYQIMADRLESQARAHGDTYLWDAQAWYGGDINRLWLKSEGEGSAGESPEHAELQALWSRAIAPWWNLQAGVRHDFRPNPGRTFLVVGLQGLMPYRFATDAAAFVSEDGDLSLRLATEYEFQITQRLILQPRVEVDVAAEQVPEIRLGSGITSAEFGLRLRYQIEREFAPYIGLDYGRSFGGTADYARAAGDDVGGWSVLVGLRTWF